MQEFRINFVDKRSPVRLGIQAAFRAGENGLSGPRTPPERPERPLNPVLLQDRKLRVMSRRTSTFLCLKSSSEARYYSDYYHIWTNNPRFYSLSGSLCLLAEDGREETNPEVLQRQRLNIDKADVKDVKANQLIITIYGQCS